MTEWLARRYADVWPARDDDLPGELWRPIPGVEGFDCSSQGRVRHYPTRIGRHAEREPTPGESQRLLTPRPRPGEWDDFVTLSGPDLQPESFAASELVRYTFGEVAHGDYVRRKTGKAPVPSQEPEAAPTQTMPSAGTSQEQSGAGTMAIAGPPSSGNDPQADPNDWRRVAGWPYDANRAGQVRSYHDTKSRTIATIPQRFLKPIDDPVLGPCVRLWNGKGGNETVAVAELLRRVFGTP